MIARLRQAWDRLSIYLPLMAMGLLALGTYWLVRSTPQLQPPPAAATAPREDPDYVMERFGVRTFDAQGRLRSALQGEQARHYPHTDVLEIEDVRLRRFGDRGQVLQATARRALVNSDGSEVQLIGDVRVVREAAADPSGAAPPPLSLRGEFLHAFLDEDRLKSHKPVELRRGQDVITADSLDYRDDLQVIELRGQVRGTLRPRP